MRLLGILASLATLAATASAVPTTEVVSRAEKPLVESLSNVAQSSNSTNTAIRTNSEDLFFVPISLPKPRPLKDSPILPRREIVSLDLLVTMPL